MNDEETVLAGLDRPSGTGGRGGKRMTQHRRGITSNDLAAVGYTKLLLAAIVGVPVGVLIAFVFTVIFVMFMPAGDLVFIANPIIGGVGGFFVVPIIVVRKRMERLSRSEDQ